MKKTVVIGASTNPERYAHRAVRELRYHGHPVVALGLKPGQIADVNIHTDKPQVDHTDTVTLYVGPANQPFWYDYILQLQPKRVIFNPGTENPDFASKLEASGIATEESCTLVLLSIGNY